ncbi:MAG TPA: sigma-54 dependent transcriptional regulator [Sedimentisphaerales bacterium]|nr:sigma-54 dependent transcriptional regulator [Sedimentisphaerales bacterium]
MSKGPVILVVDDEPDHADGIAEALEKVCAKAIAVYNGTDALEILGDRRVDVVVTDLKLGDGPDGLKILEQVKKTSRHTEVILITAYATIDTCKQAIKKGAYDYLVKPIDIDQLRTLVEQAGRKASAAAESSRAAPVSDSGEFRFEGIWGTGAKMKGILEVLRRVCLTNISVLIEGASGTGKELLARAIHDNSRRAGKPFKPINCAGLAETLLESELFGHIRGAFTGASTDRKGLFEQAHKGTLFLDEIGDMPLNMQAKLLRVLEDGIVVPVGSSSSVVVDVRFISATNHDLMQLVGEKRFRQDLYFRIKGVNIVLPGLSERAQDIPPLCDYFIQEAARETGLNVTGITDAAKSILSGYEWPGNIRQLRNCIRTMVVMCDRDQLDVGDIPPEILQRRQLGAGQTQAAGAPMALDQLEKQAIIETLKETDNNREKAAKILGIGERTLYRKIKEYKL